VLTFQFVGLLVLPVRGEAAAFMHIERGDDNQHEEPERGMEHIAAELAGSGVVGRPCEAGQRADAQHIERDGRDSVVSTKAMTTQSGFEQSPGRVI
jgi:hypothetical protein